MFSSVFFLLSHFSSYTQSENLLGGTCGGLRTLKTSIKSSADPLSAFLVSSLSKISSMWLWVVRTHSVGACRFCSSAFAVFIGVPTFPRIRASVSRNGVVSTDPIRTANRTDAFTSGFHAVAARFESLFSFDSIIFCNCSIRLLLFLLIDL